MKDYWSDSEDLFGLIKDTSPVVRPPRRLISPSDLSKSTKEVLGTRLLKILRRWIQQIKAKLTGRKLIEVLGVLNSCQADAEFFEWGWIGVPAVGDRFQSSTLVIDGWIVGKQNQPKQIQIVVDRQVIATGKINVPRPDVIKVHFYSAACLHCGYRVTFRNESLPRRGFIEVHAVFSDGVSALVGKVEYDKYGY